MSPYSIKTRTCRYAGCPNIFEGPFAYCLEHREHAPQIPKQRFTRDAKVTAFYRKSVWKNVRARQLSNHPLCVACGAFASVVDHVLPITQGGERLDPDNLQSMCVSCHNRKSAHESNRKSPSREKW